MKVGILGSGVVAQTLASGFIRHGHAVMLGTREPDKLQDWRTRNPKGQAGGVAEAARFGELLVLAVRGGAAAAVLRAAGADNLAGKVVIDTNNPLADAPPVHGVLPFFTGPNESLMERLQQEFPDARLVKAFNSVGAGRMVNPQFVDGRPTMFICGNDVAAKRTVTGVLAQFGWDTADMGQVEAARAIEPLCMLWCIRGFLGQGWDHAFKLLT
jgi:predicted dinucleotide-binding enzyme